MVELDSLAELEPALEADGFFGRLRDAEDRAGIPDGARRAIGYTLYLVALFLLPFELVYAQQHLNRLWETTRS